MPAVLITRGVPAALACDAAVARPMTDDRDMQRSIQELVKADLRLTSRACTPVCCFISQCQHRGHLFKTVLQAPFSTSMFNRTPIVPN